MRKKRVLAWIMAMVVSVFFVTPVGVNKVKAADTAMTILDADVTTPSLGCQLLGVYGSYYSEAQEALDRMNAIRKEACDAGNVPDPRDKSRMLTSSDYVPLKWSSDLESIARIRAVEGGLMVAHKRLNGKDIWSVEKNGVDSNAEDLAFNWNKDMTSGIEQFYDEKSDWVNQISGTVTGHYTSMINPKYHYVGLGDFYTEEAQYPNTLAAEFSMISSGLDETMQDAPVNVMQKIEVLNSDISGYYVDGNDTLDPDWPAAYTLRAQYSNGSVSHNLWVPEVTYTSSDPSVATVDSSGNVTGMKEGTVTITAKVNGTVMATKKITVKSNSVNLPTKFSLYWKNSTSTNRYYSSAFPSTNPVGSEIECWVLDLDGDSDYQYVRIESSDESVISVPKTPMKCSSIYKLQVLAPGTTTLTMYLQYHPSVKKTIRVQIHESSEEHEHEFASWIITKQPTCTATGLKTRTCNTCGEKETAAIPKKAHQIVTDEAVAPTCTTPGKTEGSHCAVCGEIFEEQTEIAATGHKWETQYTIDIAPTETSSGIKSIHCSICSARKNITVMSQLGESGDITTEQPGSEEYPTTEIPSGGEHNTTQAPGGGEHNTTQAPGTGENSTTQAPGYGGSNNTQASDDADREVEDEDSDNVSSIVIPENTQKNPAVGNILIGNSNPAKTTVSEKNNDTAEDVELEEDFDDEEDEDSEYSSNKKKQVPKTGEKFQVKGITYQVTKVDVKKLEFSVKCIKMTNGDIRSLVLDDVYYKGYYYDITAIGKNAFSGCKKLKQVTLGSEIKTIGNKAFYGCSALKKVMIPGKVKSIGSQAFAKCKQLSRITIKSTALTKNSVGSKAFYGIHKKAIVRVPSSKKAVYQKWLKKKGISGKMQVK